jgi:hypothetical protein
MEELRAYLRAMDTDEARSAFAEACGTTSGHLRNVSYGQKLLSPVNCVALEAASGLLVRRWHLRPDDWHRIWPELIGAEGAPEIQEAA